MKKTNLIKLFSILLVSVMVISMATMVNAADGNNGFVDMTNSLSSSNSSNSSSTGNNATNNAATNNATNNTNKANNTTNNTNKANNTNNSSVYNNTNLPKTGLASSLPIAALVVVFGISAVYAYKKVSDYKNI